jgi:hypothetical protein
MQFVDDAHRGRLRSILAELRPVELIKPVTGLDSATERALKDHTRQPLINSLEPGKEVRVLFCQGSSIWILTWNCGLLIVTGCCLAISATRFAAWRWFGYQSKLAVVVRASLEASCCQERVEFVKISTQNRENSSVVEFVRSLGPQTRVCSILQGREASRYSWLTMTTCSHLQFWTADRTKTELGAFFGPLDPAEGASSWPPSLQNLARAGGRGEAAISALGGTIFYLRQALLESDVLALGRIEPLPGSAEACVEAPVKDGEGERELYMVLDSAALENLEV